MESELSLYSPTKRRRGAQPGNTNRLTHGLYSKRFAPEGNPTLNGAEPIGELILARRRLRELIRCQQKAPPRQMLAYERAIIRYVGLIASLYRTDFRLRVARQLLRQRSQQGLPAPIRAAAAGIHSNLDRTSDLSAFFEHLFPLDPAFEPQNQGENNRSVSDAQEEPT